MILTLLLTVTSFITATPNEQSLPGSVETLRPPAMAECLDDN